MNKFLHLALSFMLASPNGWAVGRIQNEDVKSLADIQSVVSITGNVSSGSACIASPSSLTGLSAGLFIYDATNSTRIPSGTTITAIPGTCSAGQIQMSQNAAGSGTGDTITFGGQMSQLINDSKIYVTANGINSQLSTAITNGLIGGGGGSKNYLANGVVASNGGGSPNPGNGDFEKNSTSGWSLAHSAISSNIPTSVGSAGVPLASGTGLTAANGNLSLAIVSSSPIQKKYSANYASSAASVAGDLLLSDAFYIDSANQADSMSISFNYRVNSGGSNIDMSGTSANSFSIWMYDVTNAVWLQPQGVYNIIQKSGDGFATATFQTSSNGIRYQLALVNNVASAGAFSLYVDDFRVGPVEPATDGRVIAAAASAGSQAVGSGAPTPFSSAYYDTTGSLTLATGRFTVPVSGLYRVSAVAFKAAAGNSLNLAKNGTPYIALFSWAVAGGATSGSVVVDLKAGDYIDFRPDAAITISAINVFIERLSGPTSGDEGRVVSTIVLNSATSLSSSVTKLALSTISSDTHAAWSSSTYTVPVSGYYRAGGYLTTASGSWSAGGSANLFVKHNASLVAIGLWRATGSTGAAAGVSGDTVFYCNAGDTLEFHAASDVVGAPNSFRGYISRINGVNANAAPVSVNASYKNTAGTSISNSGDVNVPFATKLWDSHNAFSGTVYTAPVSGKYRISAGILFASSTYAAGNRAVSSVYKNGVKYKLGQYMVQESATTSNLGSTVSALVDCVSGDTIEVRISNNRTAGSTSLSTTDGDNWFDIERVGN